MSPLRLKVSLSCECLSNLNQLIHSQHAMAQSKHCCCKWVEYRHRKQGLDKSKQKTQLRKQLILQLIVCYVRYILFVISKYFGILQTTWPLSSAGSAYCLQLFSAVITYSRHLQYSQFCIVSVASLLAASYIAPSGNACRESNSAVFCLHEQVNSGKKDLFQHTISEVSVLDMLTSLFLKTTWQNTMAEERCSLPSSQDTYKERGKEEGARYKVYLSKNGCQ